MSRSDNTVSFENVTTVHATAIALLCNIDGNEVWIPISVIHDDSEVYKLGTEGTLIIWRKFAEDKGLV